MKYTKIKDSDIEVSSFCLGCMSFGKRGSMHAWTLDQEETDQIVKHALEVGINFFDTANCYSLGTSEEQLGKAIQKYARREDVIIASKVYFNEGRLKKEAIKREIEGTLTRLNTSYLDLYLIHRFDYETPIEETMDALNELIQEGKVRAIGASAMFLNQFKEMNDYAINHHLHPFVTMENHYNLLYREDEKDMIPYCLKNNILLMPYSPLAGGHLTRDTWDTNTLRSKTDNVLKGKYDNSKENDLLIIKRVKELAEKHCCKMSSIALSYLFYKGVSSPIIGATKKE